LFQPAKDQRKITTTTATSGTKPQSPPAPKVAAATVASAPAPAAVKIAKADAPVETKAAKSQPNESPEKTDTAPKQKKDAGASVPVANDLSPLTKPAKPQLAAAPSAPVLPRRIDATTLAVPKMDLSLAQAAGPRISTAAAPQPVSFSGDSAFIRLADGFDYPVGKPDAQGYYKARGFRSKGHLGEDWDGVGGGDTDLGDSIFSIGNGVVVFARDCHMGWGNVIIVRHSYREGGTVHNIDALYGHLQSMLVKRGQTVARGQKIATMGNAHGLYDAHLHLEIRKNLEIGMSRAAFARDFSNYYDPSTFIATHRHLSTNGGTYKVAMNTFTHDARINWDKARNYSHPHTGGGSSESAAALKKALATSSH
jgi:murein DD-endopeptidase MepM/ murein hydrolase activator NlpD